MYYSSDNTYGGMLIDWGIVNIVRHKYFVLMGDRGWNLASTWGAKVNIIICRLNEFTVMRHLFGVFLHVLFLGMKARVCEDNLTMRGLFVK